MGQRITGRNINAFFGGVPLVFKNATLNIEDGVEAAMTNGGPDGWIEGDYKASGELEMDYKYFKAIVAIAAASGSYTDIPAEDIDFPASTTGEVFTAKAHGCKLSLSEIINADKNGKTVGTVKIPYIVTSPDFVDIDGVPYRSALATLGVIG